MNNLIATSIKYQQGVLYVLDQCLLPHQTHWLRCETLNDMINMIHNLQIRGAPLIGIGASLMVAHLAEQGYTKEKLLAAIQALSCVRPTAINIAHDMLCMRTALEANGPQGLISCAETLFTEDMQLCEKMANHGARLIPDGANILTHCNTGSLATTGIGTAIGVIAAAKKQGKKIHVWVDETRPLLQGARLTTWEMERLNIPHTLICDSAAAMLMAEGKIDSILVGCDRIVANGDIANKVGTYSLAVNAKYHNIPFYVIAPHTTLDKSCPNGDTIPIEQRCATEVKGVSGSFGDVQWATNNTAVYNPAFDMTPAALITAWVLDSGVYTKEQIIKKMV